MYRGEGRPSGYTFAIVTLLFATLLAGCGQGGPAPVVYRRPGRPPFPLTTTVQPGQTLSGIALSYHVPMQVLAEANRLSPPYRIIAGGVLVIPGAGRVVAGGSGLNTRPISGPGPIAEAGSAIVPPARQSIAALPPSPPSANPGALVEPIKPAAEAPPKSTVAPIPGPAGATTEQEIPLDRAPPDRTEKPAALPPAAASPGMAAAPVSGPPAAGKAAVAAVPPRPPHGGGAFMWPVRGHILESYGNGRDGTHNDGINIAAPRGAAVQATDAGIVAYAGNELRGYGNLILIKHANGWISAYAHCDLILVRKGEKVGRGQVIARVGSTGSVAQPQLHFELRRGDKPVNPREYLTPVPTAAGREARAG